MKRVASLSLGLLLLSGWFAANQFNPSQAQTAPTDEVAIIQLTTPTNAVGVTIRSVSNDGKRFVWDSINDYDGSNVDSNREILLFDADLNQVFHLTTTKDLTETKTEGTVTTTTTTLRVTNNTPVLSGDGTKIVFTSNSELTSTKNTDGNQEVYLIDFPRSATKKEDAKVTRLTDTEKNYDPEVVKEIFSNYNPTINDDGSAISFVSTRRVFKAVEGSANAFTVARESSNASLPVTDIDYTDGNGEILLYRPGTRSFSQVTLSRDRETIVNFAVRGFNNFPNLSGDGRRLAFLSAFNYAGGTKNSDFNGEIFTQTVGAALNTFTQVTETSGTAAIPTNAPVNLFPTFARSMSRDGNLMVFESAGNFGSNNADKSREVWLYNFTSSAFTRITNQSVSATPTTDELLKVDYSFQPSINSTGTFITFGSTLNLTPATTSSITADNADASREVFRYDIAKAAFRQLTFTPKSNLVFVDDREIVVPSYADNTGNTVTFSNESDLIASGLTLNPEAFRAVIYPVTSKNSAAPTLSNAASFISTEVARGSIVAAFGMQLANATRSASTIPLPYELGGVRITVAGIAAQLIFVSGGQINFVMPTPITIGDTVAYSINNNGLQATGTIKVVDVSPGVFAITGDGKGKGATQCGRVSDDGLTFEITNPPCSVGNEISPDILTIYGTGWRNGAGITVVFGDLTLTPTYSGAQPNLAGLDQINVPLIKDLADKKDTEFSVNFGTVISNKTTTSFLPFVGGYSVFNSASFEGTIVARGSLAHATGENLSKVTADGAAAGFPFELGGVKITVAGRPARIAAVSPTRVTFVVPDNTAPADAVALVLTNTETTLRSRATVRDGSPGLFTTTDDGDGRAVAKCGQVAANGAITLSDPPCAVSTDTTTRILRLTGTGWRFADKVAVILGDQTIETLRYKGGQPNGSGGFIFGRDQIDVDLPAALAAKTDQDAVVRTTDKTGDKSSKAGIKISFQ